METACFNIEIPAATEPVVLTADALRMVGEWAPPQARPEAPGTDCWVHRERTERTRTLAGHEGRLVADTFTSMGMELLREIWIGSDGDAVAIRQKIRNRGADDLRLDALLPLSCEGTESLLLNGEGPGAWDVLAQQRLKNGVPTSLRPGVFDGDYAHAVKGTTELGDTPGEVDARTGRVEMDPLCLLRLRDTPGAPVLFAGYISQIGHCARLILQFRTQSDCTQLERFTAECEFDGCVLPPGGERTGQWLLLRTGTDADELLSDFADRVGHYHGVKPPPKPAPTVYCTWQYYGPYFTERDFAEDVAHLEKDRVPFDVFLIDECWDMSWGDWYGSEEWPGGMAAAADRIRALGYRPGIWTCPSLAKVHSRLASDHSEWLLRLEDGTPHIFRMDGLNYVLDPTHPGVCDHIEETFRRLTHDWGFTYHKLDFLRSIFIDKRTRFYDPAATRLEAYRMALEAVRRGAGPDAYISACGGHYGGSLGLADSQRSGSDVAACWDKPPALPKFKQNVLRTWMNRLWHTDPDAMMVRRRDEPINDTQHGFLSLGRFTDEEAGTIAVNQYAGGGMVCLCEKFLELDADRKALYRHVVPSVDSPSIPLDPFEPMCPSMLLTRVTPRCGDLEPWVTLCVVNWTDAERPMNASLTDQVVASMSGSRFLVFDFFTQEALGIFEGGAEIELGTQAPHTSRVLRIAPWDGERAMLAGTDLHFSGGGVEVAEWQAGEEGVTGRIETRWDYPVRVTVAFPKDGGFAVNTVVVEPGQRSFRMERP